MMLFLISGIASPFLKAQDSNKKFFKKSDLPNKSWVYEKDGEPIWAIVTKDNGTELSYIDKNGQKKKISYESIKKVKQGAGKVTHSKNGKFFYDEGFFFTIFASLNLGGPETGTAQGIIGFKPTNRLRLGLGFGMDSFSDEFGFNRNETVFFDNNQNFFFYSLFGYGRYDFLTKGPRVYAFSRVGYGKGIDFNAWEDVFSNGANVHGGLGMCFGGRSNMRLVTEFGFAVQKVSGEFRVRDQLTNQDITSIYNSTLIRPQLKIGVQFH